MKRLSVRHLVVFLVFLSLTFVSAGAMPAEMMHKNPEKSLFGKKRKLKKTKSSKASEPRSVTKAKRTQEKKQLKIKKDYFSYVGKSRKRAYQIQSPEVKARMNQNEKDIKAREKASRKSKSGSTRRGASKYRK